MAKEIKYKLKRKFDDKGRVNLKIEFLKELGFENNNEVYIIYYDKKIIIKPIEKKGE